MNCLRPLAVLALAAAATAQTTFVYPTAFANREGQSSNSYLPFGYGPSRSQIHYLGNALPMPNQTAIRAVGFRQDGATAANEPAYRVQMEVRMGVTTRRLGTLTGTYATNYDGTPVMVFARRFFDLPARPASTTQPSSSVIYVPLDAPFTFDSSNNLLFDVTILANNNANQPFLCTTDLATHQTASSRYGTACQTSTNTTPELTADEQALGQGWNVTLVRGAPSSGAALMVGLGNTSWSGLPLPFDLAPLGAPGCTVHVDVLVSMSRFLSAGGGTSWSLPTPNDISLDGASLYGQVAMVDLFANNFGIITSNGVRTTFRPLTPITLLYHQGNPAQATGSLVANWGPVTFFQS